MSKKIAGLGIPLLFILPISGFVMSLFNVRSRSSAFIYIGFAMLFGYAISFSDSSADSYRYAEAFARFDNLLDYKTVVQMYRNGELRDVYSILLFYFTSLFSNNPKVMYAIAGMVYGIFSYLSLRIFVRERGPKSDPYLFIMVLMFYTLISLSNINGFRFWTGALVLFFSLYQFIIQRKIVWVVGIAITPLFHYSFVMIIPFFLIYRFLEPILYNKKGVNPSLFYAFVVAFASSWVLKENSINLGFLSEADVLTGAVAERVNYVNSSDVGELVANRREASLFLGVQLYFGYVVKIFVFLTIVSMRKWINKMTGNKTHYTRLFAFVLYFLTIGYLASSIPSGGRFLSVAYLFLLILLARFYLIHKGKSIKKLIVLGLVSFSFSIAFTNFMLPILILSSTFWYGNLFWILMEGINFRI